MSNVVSLSDYSKSGWMQGNAKCLACEHEWQAVAPAGTTWLECPECGCHKGVMKYPCDAGDGDVWACECGCRVFYMTPKSTRCCNCGAPQVLP